MKVITSKEAAFLKRSRNILAKEGIILSEIKTKRLKAEQAILIKETVEFIQRHKLEMKKRDIVFDEKLQLEFLTSLTKSITKAAKDKKSSSSEKDSSEKELGIEDSDKDEDKEKPDSEKDFREKAEDDPEMQKSMQSAANQIKISLDNCRRANSQIDRAIKKLPPNKQSAVKSAAMFGNKEFQKHSAKILKDIGSKLDNDDELAQLVMSGAIMKLFVDSQA